MPRPTPRACASRSPPSTTRCTSSPRPGLLREVAIDGGRTYFDTNTSDHHHFFVEGEGMLIDLVGDIDIDGLPKPPAGMEITSVDVVVRVRRGCVGWADAPLLTPMRSAGVTPRTPRPDRRPRAAPARSSL